MLDCIDKNPAALDPNARKNAVGIRTTYEPTYRQIFSGTDISFPIGVSYFPMSRSSVIMSFGPNNGGDFSAGVNVAYLDAWRFGVSLTGYYGTSAGFLNTNPVTTAATYNMRQDMADRYNVSFNIRRTIGFNFKGREK
jgi:hypothetical protein